MIAGSFGGCAAFHANERSGRAVADEASALDLTGEGPGPDPVDPFGPRPGASEAAVSRFEPDVHPVEKERPQRAVGRDVGRGKPQRRENDDAQQQPRAQREAAHYSSSSSM